MGREVSLKPGGGHGLLDDAGDVPITESAVLEEEWGVATTREGEAPEERAAGLDVRLLDPPPERCNGADGGNARSLFQISNCCTSCAELAKESFEASHTERQAYYSPEGISSFP
jgi:hypothetical protein